MANPFPGIDPFVENQNYWSDFHHTFINYCREALNDRLPDHYEARIDERVSLVDVSRDDRKQFLPDVAVSQVNRPVNQTSVLNVPGAVFTEPVSIPLTYLDEETEVYIEILHREDRSLVTVVEILSPTNKSEPGRTEYLIKRNALLREPVHLVELDFLVEGRRLPMERTLPRGDYYAIVARAERRPDGDVYAWSVRQPLPTIKVPLLPPDEDIPLDLAAVVATTYQRGRYGRSINYDLPLTLPLSPEDCAWAGEQARSSRSR
jgi:hypothetical protein